MKDVNLFDEVMGTIKWKKKRIVKKKPPKGFEGW